MHLVAFKNVTLCLIALIKVLHRVNHTAILVCLTALAKPFGIVFVQVWFPYLREIDALRTISKDECKTSKKFFRK